MSIPEQNQPQFLLQRIYLKDVSFEAPIAPEIFLMNWQPKVDIELQTTSQSLNTETYEVTVFVTVTAKVEEKVAFIVEIKQGGIFSIVGVPEEQIKQILGITCPNILFPYVREAISDLVTKGSFPQLLIEPINFEALYQQQQLQQQNPSSATIEAETTH